jgi:hypothetical protein
MRAEKLRRSKTRKPISKGITLSLKTLITRKKELNYLRLGKGVSDFLVSYIRRSQKQGT